MISLETSQLMSLLLMAALLPVLFHRPLARLLGLLWPGGSEEERREVAGGLAIYVSLSGLLFAIETVTATVEFSLWWLQALLFSAVLLGTVEQVLRLPTQFAIPIRLLLVMVAFLGGFGFNIAGPDSFRETLLNIPLTLLFYLGMMASVSVLDRLPGLATGVTLLMAATLLGLVLHWPAETAPLVLLAVAGICMGHLLGNQWSARLRLGVAAQLQFAMLLSAVTIASRSWGFTLGFVFISLLAVAIPMVDRFFSALLRFSTGKEQPASDHLQSLLLSVGFSERWIVYAVWIVMLQVGVLVNVVYTTESLAILVAGGASLVCLYSFGLMVLVRLGDRMERHRDPGRLRILFLSHYYHPEVNAPASRLYEHARCWARAGHEVTVITAVPSAPHGWAFAGYRNVPWQEEVIEGVRVIRVWTFMAANRRRIRRSLNYASYMVSAVVALLLVRRHDVVVATSPQFFCGLAGAVASVFRKEPFVLEVRDIWPESIVAVDAGRRNFVYGVLIFLARWMYRRAARIVTVGDGYRDKLIADHGLDPNSIDVVCNGVDFHLFDPSCCEGPRTTLEQMKLADKFVVSYVGTVGMAHGLDVVLRAGELLKRREDIAFLIAGDGSERGNLERRAREMNLSNVHFAGLLRKEEIPRLIGESDACLVHLRDKPLFATVLPSKLFEAMAMERPVIMGVRGGSAEIVARHNAGICIPPEDAEALARAVERIAANREMAAFMGANGAAYVREHHARERLADRYAELLSSLRRDRVLVGGALPSPDVTRTDQQPGVNAPHP